MADFSPALLATLKYEGGYCNVAGDAGGETYCGIARHFFPNNPLWPIIDNCKKKAPIKTNQIIKGEDGAKMNAIIADFYRIQFWDGIRGNDIKSQSVAAYLFDWFVNSGNIAVRQVQEMLSIDTDGHIGNQTLHAINAADAHTLWNHMVATRVQRARDRVAHNASQAKFLKGWLARFQSFKFEN